MRKFNFNNKSNKFHNYALCDMKKLRQVISVFNFIIVSLILLHMEVRISKLSYYPETLTYNLVKINRESSQVRLPLLLKSYQYLFLKVLGFLHYTVFQITLAFGFI